MRITGIISEYNPFHNGHKLHLEISKNITSADYIIAVMSGNFVQRGEPAIFDKYLRTKTALQNGVDLVIELPFLSACATGEYFADGAIKTLNAANIIDSICFGSECGDINMLTKTANILLEETESLSGSLKQNLSSGLSFPSARAIAVAEKNEDAGIVLNHPNNILAVEYIKALCRSESSIKPYTIKRISADYHSEQITGNISSATAVRKAFFSDRTQEALKAVPENCRDLYMAACLDENIAQLDNLSHILHYIINLRTKDEIANALDISEGIENRIIQAAEKYYSINDIMSEVKTKRYTMSKIRRIILQIILDISKCGFEVYKQRELPYIRVLGFKRSSENVLKELHSQSRVPVVTNLKHADSVLDDFGREMLAREIAASDIYYMSQNSYRHNSKEKWAEYGIPLVII